MNPLYTVNASDPVGLLAWAVVLVLLVLLLLKVIDRL